MKPARETVDGFAARFGGSRGRGIGWLAAEEAAPLDRARTVVAAAVERQTCPTRIRRCGRLDVFAAAVCLFRSHVCRFLGCGVRMHGCLAFPLRRLAGKGRGCGALEPLGRAEPDAKLLLRSARVEAQRRRARQ